MSWTKATDERERGLAMVDTLLVRSRPLQPFPPATHQRVKRRLRHSLLNRNSRRSPWLRPVVVASALLFSATASGIAWQRLMLPPSPEPDRASTPAMEQDHQGTGRGRPRSRGPRMQALSAEVEAPLPTEVEAPPPPETAAGEPSEAPAAYLASADKAPAVPSPAAGPASLDARARPARPTRLAFASPRSWATGQRPAPPPSAWSVPATSANGVAASPRPPVALEPPPPPSTPMPPVLAWRTPAPEPATQPASAPPVASAEPVPAAEGPREEQLLAPAVRALRVEHAAEAALAALDDYQRWYSNGRLSIEASVLRAEALTTLGRNREALRDLNGIDLGKLPGAVGRRLERGELRETGGQLDEALADFDWVLVHAQSSAFIEAAMAGRMRCRQRMGDTAGARGDAVEYLRLFPGGPSARRAQGIAGEDAPSASP